MISEDCFKGYEIEATDNVHNKISIEKKNTFTKNKGNNKSFDIK